MHKAESPTTSLGAHLAPGVSEWLTSPVGPIGLGLALALGQARILGAPAVVAISYYAALTGLGFRWLPMVACTLLASFGLMAPSYSEIYSLMGALMIVHLLAAACQRLPFRRAVQAGVLALVGIVANALLQTIGTGTVPFVSMLPSALLGLLVAVVMAPGPQAIRRGRPLALEEQVALATIGLAAFGGALSLPAIGTWVAAAVGAFVLVQAAMKAGHAGGAVAGAVLGVACFLFGNTAMSQILGLAFAFMVSGLVAGIFRSLGRWSVVIAAALCSALVLGELAPDLIGYLFAIGGGALLGGLVVTDLSLLPAPSPRQDERAAAHTHPRQRIMELARLFASMRKSFDEVAAHAPVDAASSGLTQSLASVHDAVCKSCALQHLCWEQDVFRTYQGLQRLWDGLESGSGDQLRGAQQDFSRRCVSAEQIVSSLGVQYERRQTERAWSLRLAEGRYVMAEYMQQIGHLLSRLGDDLGADRERPQGVAHLGIETHVTSAAKGEVSGDGILNTPLPDGRHLIMLSDGMGFGEEAAVQSRQALRLVHQLLAAGFSSEVAVQTVNAVLLLRSPEETFATIDLVLIDLVTGRTEITKVGAPPTLLKRGKEVLRIAGSTAPVGIVGGIRPESQVRYLRPGDCLVMCTDGLWDRLEKASERRHWLEESLRRAQSVNPAALAESLLGVAVPDGEAAPDDVTVVVINVQSGSRQTGDWQPARRGYGGRKHA